MECQHRNLVERGSKVTGFLPGFATFCDIVLGRELLFRHSTSVKTYDVLVVGGGPAGSTCARFLVAAGQRVAVLDRASFPRVKLCAGWLSNPIWDALEMSPSEYPRGLWRWKTCHVFYAGTRHAVDVSGYFIRRVEFDDYLLARSGAEVIEHQVKGIERDGDYWVVDGQFRARTLVGAAGTHCPVARLLFAAKPNRPVGAQELEFEADANAVARTRIGLDGEPELLLHNDLRGYSWNIPKTDWLNVGTGTMNPKQVREAWQKAREFFDTNGHLPEEAGAPLEKVKGHSYYLFEPAHLESCHDRGAFLIGDSLGVAQPLTAEGIYPAVVSAKLCAQAVLNQTGEHYASNLAQHPLFREYKTLWQLRDSGGALRPRKKASNPQEYNTGPGIDIPSARALSNWAVARGFAWMFAGRPIPGHRALGTLLTAARRWDRLVSPGTLSRQREKQAREPEKQAWRKQ